MSWPRSNTALTIPLYAACAVIAAASPRESASNALPENFLQVVDGVYSGGEPNGRAAFEALAASGIQTIISVDGLRPDVDLAKQFGVQYVHIPIGYDKISRESAAALAKALNERPGPHYIHCHHGKHRGPAMAAIAMRLRSGSESDTVAAWMNRAGVGEQYAGLWRDALAFEPEEIVGLEVDLYAVAPVAGIASVMADTGRTWERLQKFAAADWSALPEHPDLTAEREALMLHEAFREMNRQTFNGYEDDEFTQQMQEAEAATDALLRAVSSSDFAKATASLERVRTSCKACHHDWRN